jgi:hypothetical protein
MQALLLRVGIDTGSGGCLAPIFEDGSFEYIPIPETAASSENRTYSHLPGRIHRSLTSALPARLHHSIPHYDPEFETVTYGDPGRTKRSQLRRLVPGDLLVFYAGLKPSDGVHNPGLFIIGYFTVREVHDFSRTPVERRLSTLRRLANNAHLKRRDLDEGLVIVEGDRLHSKLLSRALPLGDAKGHVLKDLVPLIGYRGNIVRAVGRWVSETGIRRWLDEGVSALVGERTQLLYYVVASDTGFSPNVSGGHCALTSSKPSIRSTARIGDWVLGIRPQRIGPHRLAYLMRVAEAPSLDDVFHDPRFEQNRPPADSQGGNVYHREAGPSARAPESHHHEGHVHHGTEVDRVLLSTLFWVFERKAPEIPPCFVTSITETGRGYRRIRDPRLVRDLVSWVSAAYRPGVHADAENTH